MRISDWSSDVCSSDLKPLPRLMADASQGYVGAEVAVSVVSLAERLFELNIGNSLNSAWHKSVWPGDLGHDNETGLSIPVAWGVDSPRSRGAGTTSPYSSPPDWRARGHSAHPHTTGRRRARWWVNVCLAV